MSVSAILGCAWIILVSLVALMPYPRHRPYALAALIFLPVLLVLVIIDYGIIWGAVLFLCALSIYRYPAMYMMRLFRDWSKGEK